MRILIINPPYQTLTSNLGVGHQVPLGLLMIGGAIPPGTAEVRLLDAEAQRLNLDQIAHEVRRFGADIVLTGHSGSTPAHPICMQMLQAIKAARPSVVTVYGGVFPTYHAEQILRDEPAVDVVVRGEGEATIEELVPVLAESGLDPNRLRAVTGIAFRDGPRVVVTATRPPIKDLERYRTAWELIEDWNLYKCFGLGRAAIVQFSRGCPHRCTYCGQHGFWVKWRHRDPTSLADEIERLHRQHGVKFITLADENPTTLKPLWKKFLEEIAARNIDVHFFATIRATDIVRDADMLDLYRRAGILYILLGIDATDPSLIEHINKRSNMRTDEQACKLLRQHGIRTVVGHIVGLGNESWSDFRRARKVLSAYGGDLLNVMYATPHSWTTFARESAERPVVQEDQREWDYRHQVLAQSRMSPRELFLAVKLLELAHHLHPRRIRQLLFHPDRFLRRQFIWTSWRTAAVWLGEIIEFLFATRFAKRGRQLKEWMTFAAEIPPVRTPIAVTVSARRTPSRHEPRPATRPPVAVPSIPHP